MPGYALAESFIGCLPRSPMAETSGLELSPPRCIEMQAQGGETTVDKRRDQELKPSYIFQFSASAT